LLDEFVKMRAADVMRIAELRDGDRCLFHVCCSVNS
jgi:hypothetical protein